MLEAHVFERMTQVASTAPREVKVMFSSRTSREWDPDFIASVKRDGRILYQRGELPAPFAA